MKKLAAIATLLLGIFFLLAGLRPPAPVAGFDLTEFGKLPVLANGRIKPLDTVARTTLLTLQNRQRVMTPEGNELTPIHWLAETVFNSSQADTYRTFVIDNPDLLTLIGKTEDSLRINYDSAVKRTMALLGFLPSRQRRFSYQEIMPALSEIDRQAQLAQAVEANERTRFQKAVLTLQGNLIVYQQLQYSFILPESPDFLAEVKDVQANLTTGVAALRAKQAGQPYDEALAQRIFEELQHFQVMGKFGYLLAIPPSPASGPSWSKAGDALMASLQKGELSPEAFAYAGLAYSWRNDKPEEFNEIVRRYRAHLGTTYRQELKKSDAETQFNAAEPFYRAMSLYVGAFLCGVFSWLLWPELLRKVAFCLMIVAFAGATVGILARMWLEGRPPVTNLYSSALFVGWVAGALCIVLEAIFKNSIGAVAGGVIGFCTLLVAHHLAQTLGGDTMEMMRAVLDNNFWLSTHVVTITIGYGATFLAGFLALIYIVRGVFTRTLDRGTADSLQRMVYGIVCFATLFSLIGTILGGIWADQSWGRFWGWDPKENGALIIVIWNAIILHARWGALVKARGLMSLAIFGNIVTSWSWFGTNMLGVGLHSYGFMEAAFWWLVAFVASQILIIGVSLLPLERWRSFRTAAA